MLPSEFLDDVQRGRVAQDTHGDDHTSLGSQSTLQLPHVHIQSLQLDVDESQLESVLLERMKRGTPRDRGNNHLICAFERPVFFIKQRREGDEIGGRSGIRHHSVTHSEISRELLLKGSYLFAHGQTSAVHRPANGFDLFWPPRRGCKFIEHDCWI